MKAFLLVFILFIISHQAPTNCNSRASGFGVLEMEHDDCQDSTLCKVQCSDVGGNAELKLMKLNILDPSLPDQVKDSYYKTCTWELERKEILADTNMVNPQGRGQIISQYMATLGRTWRNKLPSPIQKVEETTVLSVDSNVLAVPRKMDRSAGGLNHANLARKPSIRPTYSVKNEGGLNHANLVQKNIIRVKAPGGSNKSAGGLNHANLQKPRHPMVPEASHGGITHARLVEDPKSKLHTLIQTTGQLAGQLAGAVGINKDDIIQKAKDYINSEIVPGLIDSKDKSGAVKQGSSRFASDYIAPAASSRIPTPQNLRDWVDFLLYVSNQYTFFQDLCIKHTDINKAFAEFEKKILSDAEVSLYSRYQKYDQKKIREFVLIALNKIISQFTLLYQDPTKTCGCLDIVNVISDPNQKATFTQIITETCRGSVAGTATPTPIATTADVPTPPQRTPSRPILTSTPQTTGGKNTRVCVHQNHKNICINNDDDNLVNIEISD